LTLAILGRYLQPAAASAGADGASAPPIDDAHPIGDVLPIDDVLPTDVSPRTETLATYREAVADLLSEIAGQTGPDGAVKAAEIIHERVVTPELLAVLSRTPGGPAAIAQNLLSEIWNFRPEERGPAVDLTTTMRVYLQSQIDMAWWGHLTPYLTHADLRDSADLVGLGALRRRGELRFRYRPQPRGLAGRALRKAERRVWPQRVPHTAGMRFPFARPEMVTWLNHLSVDFGAARGEATPPLWVNSMARSVEYQNHLRSLGYATVLPSAHCVGYALDLEMTWMRRFNAQDSLQWLLFERQSVGEINLIDEGQVWHVCVSPHTVARLRRAALRHDAGALRQDCGGAGEPRRGADERCRDADPTQAA
jgi:hypothetical protein